MTKHRSIILLVHAKHTKSNQAPIFDRVQNVVEIWRTEIPSAYSADAIELRKQFQARWNATFLPLLKEKSEWVEVEKALIQFTLKGVIPRLINSDSGDDLEYEKHANGLFVIAVGGNRLSRGLTLEGLCNTYFVRETKCTIPDANGPVVWIQTWLPRPRSFAPDLFLLEWFMALRVESPSR